MRPVALDCEFEAVGKCAGADVEQDACMGAVWAGSALSDVGTIGSPTGKEKAPS